jgi:hypothetical protein
MRTIRAKLRLVSVVINWPYREVVLAPLEYISIK